MIRSAPRWTALATLLVAGSAAWAIAPARPRVDDPDEEKALAAWRKVYRLEPVQVVKRIPPPFMPGRRIEAEKRFPFLKNGNGGHSLTMIYREKGGALRNPSVTFSGDPNFKGLQLIHVIE